MNIQANIKNLSIGIGVIVVLLLGFLFMQQDASQISPNEETPQVVTQEETPSPGAPEEGQSRTMWATFANYLIAAKNHDREALKEYAYAISDACKDAQKESECFQKMDAVYAAGSKFTEKDFSIVLSDAKQGILLTSLSPTSADNSIGYTRSTIFFVRDSNGNPKLLSFKNLEEWRVKKNPASTTAEIDQALSAMVKDTDQDGLPDEVERCIFPENMLVVYCNESNPNKRDSNGDGYWDSIEPLIKKP